jgi:hypothetical protein
MNVLGLLKYKSARARVTPPVRSALTCAIEIISYGSAEFCGDGTVVDEG